MDIEAIIATARDHGASDLHLEPGLPAAMRVRGTLRTFGEPMAARQLLQAAQNLAGPEIWPQFVERRSLDFSRTLAGVRCRINILQSARGVGFAVRLLASFQATMEKLNLHPDLRKLLRHPHGLILVCGPTGSGKSSTLAAFVQEINLSEPCHVVTLESPIEYSFRPRAAYIRQREVGRDTPSFEQGLLDALREDPDVLMVGEMRDPETMRLTLNASETGHLVMATVHSATCVEALQRIVSAFPAEIQGGVRAQLADTLLGVVCQRLRFRPDLNIRIPECEILVATHPVRNHIRTGDFFKIVSAMEMGAEHGMWTFVRYQQWIEARQNWFIPAGAEVPDTDTTEAAVPLPVLPAPGIVHPGPVAAPRPPSVPTRASPSGSGPIEIEPVEGGLDEVIRKLGGP